MSVPQPPKISSNFDVLFYRHSFWIQLDDFVSLRLPILVWKSFFTSQKNRRLVTFLTRSIVPDLMTMNQLPIAPVSRNVGKKSKKRIYTGKASFILNTYLNEPDKDRWQMLGPQDVT